MREILFRGKSLRTDKWIQGYLFRCWERAYIAWGMVNDNADMKEVNPKTVCQYTGLTDKNGRKIFEGDIVCGLFDNEKITGFIKYGSNAKYYIERNGLYGIYLDNSQDWLEVIGNIFDNPELLKGDKE